MTKKLAEWQKLQNKNRRSALIGIKRLLKDKDIQIDYHSETPVIRTHMGFTHTREHKITLFWRDK